MSGCPFAGKNTGSDQSISGQDIDYEPVEDSYSLPIISPYEASVSLYRKDQFLSKDEFLRSRKGFMSLSPHLQNSLFHPKHTRKMRHKEIMEKFVVFADLKSAGNVEYRKKDYMKALSIHEQAYCLFQYLDWTHEDEDLLESSITDSDFELRESIPKDTQEEKILRDIMGTCLLNMAACALRLSSFPYAVSLCSGAVELMPDSHLSYARRAQARICNLESRIEDLELGIRDAERAKNMELKQEYVDLMRKGKERISKEEGKERDFFQAFFKSVSSFGWVQAESPHPEELELEHRVIKRMLEKYREMLKFYEECDKREKLTAIRQEMQVVASVYIKMNWIHGISASSPSFIMQEEAQRAGVSLLDPKVRDVVESVKRMNISASFSGPKYNDQLLKYCIDLTVDEDKRRMRSRQRVQKSSSWNWWLFSILVILTSWGIYYTVFRKPPELQFPGK